MHFLNFSSALVIVLEICISSTGVLGAWPDAAVVVRKLVALGPSAEMPACTAVALGKDTKAYHQDTRVDLCDRMNRNVVINCVSINMNHYPNALSGEVPGATKVFAVVEDGKNEMSDKNIVGFHCKAKVGERSKSFIVALIEYSSGELGYVAYVPRESVVEQ